MYVGWFGKLDCWKQKQTVEEIVFQKQQKLKELTTAQQNKTW